MLKIDKTMIMSIAGGLLVVGGNIIKAINDKKVNDAKLVETVTKVVDEKLNIK